MNKTTEKILNSKKNRFPENVLQYGKNFGTTGGKN